MKAKWKSSTVLGVLAAIALVVAIPSAFSAKPAAADRPGQGHWKHVAGTPAPAKDGKRAVIKAEELQAYELDRGALAADLAQAPAETAGAQGLILALPAPDGEFQRFELEVISIMEPELAAKHPEITTYGGRGIDDASATIVADLTPLGFHASVRSNAGAWYIDPVYERDDSLYASYFARDLESDHEHEFRDPEGAAEALADSIGATAVPEGPIVAHRTYRLALLSDPGYADYFGAANVTAAKVTLMNRVNQIYEEETAITMVLIAENDRLNLNTAALMTDPNGPCGAAGCFTAGQATGCTGGTLGRNRVVIGQLVGASAYDIGHIIFGLPGGGVASLNSVGGNAKAQGCTGLPNPVGDFFAVDYVAHEMGHQFGGNHTFNGNQHNCSGGNRNAANSVEPGSGSSIMAYAGICRHDNLQPHTDPYWSQRSYTEITTFVNSNRAAINEVQTISLRDFDTDGDSFRLSFGGAETIDIVRGTNYTTAAIDAALEAIVGGTVTVAAWGGSGSLNDNGFQVTFTGALAATNVDSLGLNPTGASGFVGETAKGGPVDNQGHVIVETGNHAPTVSTPSAFTIPTRTPFALTAEGSDFDGDAITYLWEQNDRGGAGNAGATALVNNTKTTGPLFRVFGTPLLEPPYVETEYDAEGVNVVGPEPTRVFPDLAQILAGNTNAATGGCTPFTGVWPELVPDSSIECYSEFLPTADWVGFLNDRTLNFRVTVRDHQRPGGGVGNADTRLTIDPAAGPFLVTSQGSEATLDGGTEQSITWNVAGTSVPPIGATEVKISLSTDGGWTYPHVLAAATANDGSATVTLPDVSSEAARIKIEAVGNVFFDLSDADLALRDSHQQLAALLEASTGVGPGGSLAAKARVAAAKWAAGNLAGACDSLQAYLDELADQTGKSVTPAKAAELRALATQIRDVIGC
jgi:hypothetical protein